MVGKSGFWQTSRPMRERPLSPHLSVYKLQYTLVSSILNRLTGIALSVGLVLLAYWLTALSRGARAYEDAMACLSSGAAKVVYIGLVIAFAYHLSAGIRHLIWDTGRGLERRQSQISAWLITLATVVLVLVFGYLACGWGAHTR